MTTHGRYDAQIATTNIKGTRSDALRRNRQRVTLGASGGLHQRASYVLSEAPTITYDTHDLGTLLTALAATTAATPNAAGAATLHYLRAAGDGPGYAGGSTAVRVTAATARHYLDGLTWSTGQAAVAACTAYCLSSNGTTAPVAESVVAEPAAVAACPAWVLSAATWDGTDLRPVAASLTIAHRATSSAPPCFTAGAPYPTRCVAAGPGGALGVTASLSLADLDVAVDGDGTLVLTFRQLADTIGYGAGTITATLTGRLDDDLSSQQDSPTLRGITITGIGAPALTWAVS